MAMSNYIELVSRLTDDVNDIKQCVREMQTDAAAQVRVLMQEREYAYDALDAAVSLLVDLHQFSDEDTARQAIFVHQEWMKRPELHGVGA